MQEFRIDDVFLKGRIWSGSKFKIENEIIYIHKNQSKNEKSLSINSHSRTF